MTIATVTFDRLGRTHNPPPLTVHSDDRQVIADEVFRYARRFLFSSGINVDVDDTKVTVFAGFHVGGTGIVSFTEASEPFPGIVDGVIPDGQVEDRAPR